MITISRSSKAGFTLIEMVMVIAITAILAAVVATFIARPVEGYEKLSVRTALVGDAETSLRRMAIDIRSALPNSVRVTNTASGFAVEMLPTFDGVKYNTAGIAATRLDFFGDTSFDILGCFSPAVMQGNALAPGFRMVVNNLGTPGNDVYADAGLTAGQNSVITAAGLGITIAVNPGTNACGVAGNLHRVTFGSLHDVKGAVSTNRRLYVISTPVTYLCDVTSGSLTRYANYPIQASQPTNAMTLNGLAGVSSAQVVGNVSACSIQTNSADVRNRSVASISLSLASQGEQITLVQQSALNNSR